jgi:hypothetical protein
MPFVIRRRGQQFTRADFALAGARLCEAASLSAVLVSHRRIHPSSRSGRRADPRPAVDLYQSLNVSEGRVVANPAPVFFPGRLVVPHNLEIPGRFSKVTSPTDRIGSVIERRDYSSCAVARAIRRAGLRCVLVLDGAEAREIVLGLRRCAFALVQGRPGSTAVVKTSPSAVYNADRGIGS